jgi:SAM-dependent methyltransferase
VNSGVLPNTQPSSRRLVRGVGSLIRRRMNQLEWMVDRWVISPWYGFPGESADNVWLRDLGLDDPERNSYGASCWGVLPAVFRPGEVSRDDVFLDLGCGMGRVVFEAARRYPLKRVIGVDIAPSLIAVAEATITRNRNRLRCRNIELVATDVVDYDLPGDATIVYLADPFSGDIFSAVVAELIAHVDRTRRPLRVVYYEPREEHRLLATGRARLVRNWRRGLRFWAPPGFVRLYSIDPPGQRPGREAPRAPT